MHFDQPLDKDVAHGGGELWAGWKNGVFVFLLLMGKWFDGLIFLIDDMEIF
jgi:hypothetical protein